MITTKTQMMDAICAGTNVIQIVLNAMILAIFVLNAISDSVLATITAFQLVETVTLPQTP